MSRRSISLDAILNSEGVQKASLLMMQLMLWEMGHYDRVINKEAFKLNWKWIL